MRYEVEMKFPVDDMAALERRLANHGATIGRPQLEVDIYFAHPARDFRQTDEALRIRRKGEANFVTYKGPKIDPTTKTRQEIDLAVGNGEAAAVAWTQLLTALGFTAVSEVRKRRRKAHVNWQDRAVEVSLDDVENLGTYAELELVVDEDELQTAKTNVAALAAALVLERSERRSYLELVMEGH